jgi:hypothetical protein
MVLSGGATADASGDLTINGACLGGAEIPNDGSSWAGTWTNLPVAAGRVTLTVLPTTAAVVALQMQPLPELDAATIDNALQLTVTMPPPFCSTILEFSMNLRNWSNVYTSTPPFTYTDSMKSAFPTRFYRALLGP